MSISNKKKSYTGSIIALVVLLILVLAANYFKQILMPPVDVQIALDTQCDLRKSACHSILEGGGEVIFEITPNSLPVLKPISLKLSTQGLEISEVQVNLVGVNMDMGINLTTLTQNTPNTFIGTTQIPACMHDKMLWEAQVIVQTPKATINIPYRFYTNN